MTGQLIADDPEQDGTPDAHPAYWRGHADGTAELLEACRIARELCDMAGYDGVRRILDAAIAKAISAEHQPGG